MADKIGNADEYQNWVQNKGPDRHVGPLLAKGVLFLREHFQVTGQEKHVDQSAKTSSISNDITNLKDNVNGGYKGLKLQRADRKIFITHRVHDLIVPLLFECCRKITLS